MATFYQMKQNNESQLALARMPPRSEEELDPVTLHNQALLNLDTYPTDTFEKLQFLLQQNPCPPEAFPNLLIACVKYDYFDMVADVLAENTHLACKYLSRFQYDFFEAVITRQTSPEESFKKLDAMLMKLTETMRKCSKQVEEGRRIFTEELIAKGMHDYEEALAKYIPVLMQQAKIYWDLENYEEVEKIFKKSCDYCNDDDTWNLNVAHVLFMHGNKFKDAANFYEVIVKKHFDDIFEISAIVWANLCLSYAITGQMEEAEELIRKIEKEEQRLSFEQPDKPSLHLCIVHLVLGTMYCTVGNFEFGMVRIMTCLQPFNMKLGRETWYYTKRCFLAFLEHLAKHTVMATDEVLKTCLEFLEACELYGYAIKTQSHTLSEDPIQGAKNTVTYEARILKALLLQLM